jgi:hypothetical protein
MGVTILEGGITATKTKRIHATVFSRNLFIIVISVLSFDQREYNKTNNELTNHHQGQPNP